MKKVLEKRHHTIVYVDEMQYGFIPERGIIDAVFILRRMQEEYHAKGKKLYMCIVDLEKALDRETRKVFECALKKKETSEVLVRSVMSLHKDTKISQNGF